MNYKSKRFLVKNDNTKFNNDTNKPYTVIIVTPTAYKNGLNGLIN